MPLKFLETIVFVLKISLRLKTTRGRYLLSSKKNHLPCHGKMVILLVYEIERPLTPK